MGKLLQVFNKAVEKLESGEYRVIPSNYAGEYSYTVEEEVLHWMLYKTMRDRSDRRYKKVLDYIKKPYGVEFSSNEFSIKEICLFVSPQTKETINK